MTTTLKLPSARVPAVGIDSLFFIGNATLIVRVNGIAILTDPNFLHAGDHAHIGYGMTSRRLRDPAISIDAPADELRKAGRSVRVTALPASTARAMGILVTLDGKGGVEALRIVDPRHAIPIHDEEYAVMKSPLADVLREVEAAGWADRVTDLGKGETYVLS